MLGKGIWPGLIAVLVVAGCQEGIVDPAIGPDATLASFAERGSQEARRGMGNPIRMILEKADELSLSGNQVAELTRIGDRFDAEIQPLQEQLRAVVGEAPGRRPRRA